ncbi:MAG: HAD-IIA family hydrolase [Anaerolineales bacterium]|jgi:NagD protein|nr:HAD-IIA family hydrolase [Anaerolineales bacterium]
MNLKELSNEKTLNFLIDMDGALVRGREIIPGAEHFIQRLIEKERHFLILTNNPIYTPRDLAHRLQIHGLEVPEERIYTSAMATAHFLNSQRPDGTAFVIGESGLTAAIHSIGYVITEIDPDYVVLGETISYNYETVTHAIRLIEHGARFIATNSDSTGPSESGTVPGCGSMAALIEKATGKQPFFIGKPNPLMMRSALNYLDVHSEDTIMIGDRMDTDIVAGVESGLRTILVLSGVTALPDIDRYPYRPTWIINSVAEIDI